MNNIENLKENLKKVLAGLNPTSVANLYGKSLLTTQKTGIDELETILTLTSVLSKMDYVDIKAPLLREELAYAIFFDNSTRTKSAWAGAATRLGMSPVIVDGTSTQVAHGETAEETGAMLGMNSHAIGVRHDMIIGEGNRFIQDVTTGINDYLAATEDTRKVPIVNLQCDIDHPTQTLADLAWLQEYFGADGISGKKIAVSWAYSPSYAKPLSVPQGLVSLLTRFGAHVTLAHPDGYRLQDEVLEAGKKNASVSGGRFEITDSMDEAFEGADIVYPKSWGPYDLMLERVDANRQGDKAALGNIELRALEQNAKYQDWICNEERMSKTAQGDALYMHCLPADIGDEVSRGVLEKHRVNLAREANMKVYVIMALLAGAKVPDLTQQLDNLVNGKGA